jgi:hypothetical protein
MSLMGIREYGRHRNVSHVAVLKALRTGRIRQNTDGLIDAEKADRQWAANTHPARKAPHAMPAAFTDDQGFARARTVREHYEALNAKLDYEKRSAELVSAAEVKLAEITVLQEFKRAMLAIPERVAAQVAGEKGEGQVYAILSATIREALSEFADRCEAGGIQ